MDVAFGAAEGGKDQRGPTCDDVGSIQFGGDLDGQVAAAQGGLGDVGVRGRGDEVAAEADEDPAMPSRMARMESTTSRPRRRGGSNPNSSRRASPKWVGSFSQMPIVRSPWTLEWPRTGHRPAPGLPMLPCNRVTLTISLMVATAFLCWVMPIAQHTTVLLDAANRAAASWICARVKPVASRT